MRKLHQHIILFMMLYQGQLLFAQDPHNSQYYFTPMSINPALLAMDNDMKVILNYRSQWGRYIDPLSTAQATFVFPLVRRGEAGRFGGAGLNLFSDNAGDGVLIRTTGVVGGIAYNQELGENQHLSFGFVGGYFQKKLETNLLQSESQFQNGAYNPNASLGENFENEQVGFAELGTGLLWYMEEEDREGIRAYSGISFMHLNQANESFYTDKNGLPLRFTYTGRYRPYSYEQWDFIGTFLYMRQNKIQEFLFGPFVRYNFEGFRNSIMDGGSVGLGTLYRGKDALILALDFTNKNFVVSFSYDINVSSVNSRTFGAGAAETTLIWKKALKRPEKPRALVPQDMVVRKTVKKAAKDSLTYLTGFITDDQTNNGLRATILIKRTKNRKSKTVAKVQSDPKTGAFRIALEPGVKYKILVNKRGYVYSYDDIFIPKNLPDREVQKNVPITPLVTGVTVTLRNIHFDTNKSSLKPVSHPELDRLLKLLKENPKIRIELAGHTDNVGGSEFNRSLSENRTNTVRQFLLDKGIAPDRIETVGYGEDQPVAPNDTEEGRAQNRRVDFKIIAH